MSTEWKDSKGRGWCDHCGNCMIRHEMHMGRLYCEHCYSRIAIQELQRDAERWRELRDMEYQDAEIAAECFKRSKFSVFEGGIDKRIAARNGLAATVKRSGWLVYAADPDNFWSDELNGVVSDAREATWYPSKDAAQALIDARNLGKVFTVKHMAEAEVQI